MNSSLAKATTIITLEKPNQTKPNQTKPKQNKTKQNKTEWDYFKVAF